jgi:MFS transporter, PPP family, 3-phenylpropionic acid transporter
MTLKLRLVLWYALAVGSIGSLHPFLALALERAGATGRSTSLLFTLFPLGFLFAGPLWGWVADRTGRPTTVLRLAATVCAASVIAAAMTSDWRFLMPSLAALALCRAPLIPLVDVLTVKSLANSDGYGRVRMWGSVAFIGAVWTVGQTVEAHWRAPLIGNAILLGGACALSWTLPELPRPESPAKPDFGPLIRHPMLRLLAAVAVLHGLTISAYDYMFSLHIDRLGLDTSVTGAAFAGGVAAEVVVLGMAPWLLRRLGPEKLLLLGVASGIPRYLITATVTDPTVLAATQTLHGLGFGAWWVGIVAILAREAPSAMRNSAQTLLMSANYGLGPLLALGLAALLVDGPGTSMLYLVASGVSGVALILAVYALRQTPEPT